MTIATILARKGPNVVTVEPEASIRHAVGLLAERNIGALVVVDPALRPIGILSERDIVRAAAHDEHVFARPVSSIMTHDVIVGAPHDDLDSVGSTMTERRIRHLPVVEDDRLVGIVSIGDVVKAQRDRYLGEVDTLQIQLIAGAEKLPGR